MFREKVVFELILKKDILHEKQEMEKAYFSLELNRSNKLTKVFHLVLGIVCMGIALVWLILNFSTLKSSISLWITIVFLAGFGYYEVISGLGKSEKFIEVSNSSVRIKLNLLFPAQELKADEIDRLEVFPLNIVFFLKSGKTVFLRFGTTYTDIIEPVKKSIKSFCNRNNLKFEIRNEEL